MLFLYCERPKELFLRYKNITGTTEEAYNELFNFTKKLYLSENQKRNLLKFLKIKQVITQMLTLGQILMFSVLTRVK